jgi:HEAT repeat protein
MAKKKATPAKAGRGGKTAQAACRSLICELDSEDGLVRVKARKSLVTIGHLAVKPLVKSLSSNREYVRWEAAKALGQIGDPAAVQALIKALEDKMFDVRWLAAEGLIIIGRPALVPLLQAFMDDPDSFWLREGVHHVLHAKILRPVVAALEGFEPSVEAPLAADKALTALAGR